MKHAYIGIAVGVLLIVGGTVWLLLPHQPQVPVVTTQTYTEVPTGIVEAEDLVSGQGTLASLLGLEKTLECTFQFKDDVNRSEGTGFFDADRMRIDSVYTASSGKQFTANLITNGTTTYLWSNTEAGEFAIKSPASQGELDSETLPVATNLSTASVVWYACKSWQVDGSVFEPPQGVTFMDTDALKPGVSESVGL
jgi:hypothetical protein